MGSVQAGTVTQAVQDGGVVMEWEYKVETSAGKVGLGELAEWLNELGKDGWQLIDVYDGYRYIFIRPASSKVKNGN